MTNKNKWPTNIFIIKTESQDSAHISKNYGIKIFYNNSIGDKIDHIQRQQMRKGKKYTTIETLSFHFYHLITSNFMVK